MSSTESTPDSRQHYLGELSNRMGEQTSVLGLPRLIATQAMKARQDHAHQRLRESYNLEAQLNAKTLGLDLDKARSDAKADDDAMGDINVQGDTTNHYHSEPASASGASKVATVAGSALLGAAAPTALLLGQYLGGDREQPVAPTEPAPVVQPAEPQDWRLELQVEPSE